MRTDRWVRRWSGSVSAKKTKHSRRRRRICENFGEDDLMRQFLFVLFILSATSVAASGQKKYREVDLRVNGIGSGSSYAAVLARFGRPTKQTIERTEREFSCMDAD